MERDIAKVAVQVPILHMRKAPDNSHLYRDFNPDTEADWRLIQDVRKSGIIHPLTISEDGIILDGHRRFSAASYLRMEKAPCYISDVNYGSLSEHERKSLLVSYNQYQRVKTLQEQLREEMITSDPVEACKRFREDKSERARVKVDQNIEVKGRKKRPEITTIKLLNAIIRVLNAERAYWPITERRVHYLLLNDPPPRQDEFKSYKPRYKNGVLQPPPVETYDNSINSYRALSSVLTRARIAGIIPHEAIEDETRTTSGLWTQQSVTSFISKEVSSMFEGYVRDLQMGQTRHVEIVLEKNAMRQYISSVAEEYAVPCTVSKGKSSLPPRYEMKQRFVKSKKEILTVLFLTDHDPAGDVICESFIRSLRDDYGIENIEHHKVGVTPEDVVKYNLPTDVEAKESDSSYEEFCKRHGSTKVCELDAMPVTALQDKLRDTIESVLDMDTFRSEKAKEDADLSWLSTVRAAIQKQLVVYNE